MQRIGSSGIQLILLDGRRPELISTPYTGIIDWVTALQRFIGVK